MLFRSQLEVQDISDSEMSSSLVLPGFTRIQSRLNPVPESLNSPDIAPGDIPIKLARILLSSHHSLIGKMHKPYLKEMHNLTKRQYIVEFETLIDGYFHILN